jgi:ribosome modulation factor
MDTVYQEIDSVVVEEGLLSHIQQILPVGVLTEDQPIYPGKPSVERAWQVGYKAAQANLPEGRNPFISGTVEFQAWLEGWWSGFYDEPLSVIG